MKYRQLYAFLLAIIFPLAAVAAGERSVAADFFRTAPLDVASDLSEISRLDMIDYFNHGSSVRSENRFGTKVALRSLSDEMIVWQDDDSVTTTLAVIPGRSKSASTDTVLVVIRTLNSPFAESRVNFYDSRWQPLPQKDFPHPVLKDWLDSGSSDVRRAVEESVPFTFSTAEYFPDSQTLVFTDCTSTWFVGNERPDALRFMRPELRYRWVGNAFQLLK